MMPNFVSNRPKPRVNGRFLAALSLALSWPLSASEPALRLSGILTVSAKPTLALVVLPNGEKLTVRTGTRIPELGEVLSIAGDRIVVRTPEGSREFRLEGGDASAKPSASGKSPANPAMHRGGNDMVKKADENIMSVVDKLAREPSATIQDLGFALRPLLDLPPTAELTLMKGTSFEPMDSVANFQQNLTQGEMTRIKVEGVEGRHMIYLSPSQPGQATGH